MSHTSMLITGLMLAAMAIFVAPNIMALNRGRVLRNMALWLAVFCGLALIYQNFGPASPHPLFQTPDSMTGMRKEDAVQWNTAPAKDHDAKDPTNGDEGFIPPKE